MSTRTVSTIIAALVLTVAVTGCDDSGEYTGVARFDSTGTYINPFETAVQSQYQPMYTTFSADKFLLATPAPLTHNNLLDAPTADQVMYQDRWCEAYGDTLSEAEVAFVLKCPVIQTPVCQHIVHSVATSVRAVRCVTDPRFVF